MRWISGFLFCLLLPGLVTGQEETSAKIELNVTYLARDDNPERQKSFHDFLEQHFAKVTSVRRSEFDHTQPTDADVVLVDWSQREERADNYPSPLGELEDWSVPTVLLGSAGQIIAGPWRIPGGAG